MPKLSSIIVRSKGYANLSNGFVNLRRIIGALNDSSLQVPWCVVVLWLSLLQPERLPARGDTREFKYRHQLEDMARVRLLLATDRHDDQTSLLNSHQDSGFNGWLVHLFCVTVFKCSSLWFNTHQQYRLFQHETQNHSPSTRMTGAFDIYSLSLTYHSMNFMHIGSLRESSACVDKAVGSQLICGYFV